jgi:hypothetical protein
MAMTIRRAAAADVAECGRIMYDAFGAIDDQHNFPRHVPSARPLCWNAIRPSC